MILKAIGHALIAGMIYTTPYLAMASSDLQSHQSIIAAATDYLETNLTQHDQRARIEITPLDHRLKLTQCETPLESFSPPGGIKLGRTTVGVRCQYPAPWTLYVSADVGVTIPVVVAVRDLARGEALSKSDLKLQTADTSRLLRGHFETVDEVAGQTLKRTLRRGQVITPSMLVVRKTIKRGEQVTILANTGNIQVRMQGKAMKQGNPGDLIPVINSHSKRKIQARVVSKGLVRVY